MLKSFCKKLLLVPSLLGKLMELNVKLDFFIVLLMEQYHSISCASAHKQSKRACLGPISNLARFDNFRLAGARPLIR